MGSSGMAITVESLRKSYRGSPAVDDVTFEVAEGEIFGLLGPNGSGKTTTVECVQGLRRADAGRIRVLGLDPQSHRRQLRRRMGSQLQESALPDRIKVWEAMQLFASLAPGTVDWNALIDQWGLAAKRNASFASLSGGQRQRLFIALALVHDPEVVFLDEMTTGLDPAARRETWGLIEAVRDRGTTVVLVTHFMDEAERLCDRVAVLRRPGRVMALGSPRALVAARRAGTRLTFTLPGRPTGTALDPIGRGPEWLRDVPGVRTVARTGDLVTVTGDGAVIAHVGHALVERGVEADDLRVTQPSLEDVYLAITRATPGEEDADADAHPNHLARTEAVRP
ncbi:MAG: ABC transporter ATP-binding protein [Kineosporiaceae bacterium]